MPPRSPLPLRHGLAPAWVQTTASGGWASMGDWLRARVDARVDVEALLAQGRFVAGDGTVVREADPYRPHVFVFFHRDLREEPEVPGELVVVHRDERLVVVDKPPFLATVPRGRHVRQSLVVRLREQLDAPELTPLHRLDRVTSGLVACVTQARWRAAYQGLFARREVHKTYAALAPWLDLPAPVRVRDHVRAIPRTGRAEVVPDAAPNAETLVRVAERNGELARYDLQPLTGRTHQLRLHLAGLGAPIVGDPLYPVDLGVDVDDFSAPLQLLAAGLAFTDPVDGSPRRFTAARTLPLVAGA